jgi:hypothetical protein
MMYAKCRSDFLCRDAAGENADHPGVGYSVFRSDRMMTITPIPTSFCPRVNAGERGRPARQAG